MIHVTIFENNRKECVGFQTEGHAGYKDEGQDIVCAAVSVLVINTINAIEMYVPDECSVVSDEDTGVLAYHLRNGRPSEGAALLLKTMILGLESMADDENYMKYIDLRFEEV